MFNSQFLDTCMCTSLAQPYHQNMRGPAIHSYIHSSMNHGCSYKFHCSDMDSVHIHFDLLHQKKIKFNIKQLTNHEIRKENFNALKHRTYIILVDGKQIQLYIHNSLTI